jgi:hypothetical protein
VAPESLKRAAATDKPVCRNALLAGSVTPHTEGADPRAPACAKGRSIRHSCLA